MSRKTKPFADNDVAAEADAADRLVAYADDLFWGDLGQRLGVDISDIGAIHLGVYREWRTRHRINIFEDRPVTTRAKYVLVVDKNPLTINYADADAPPGTPPYEVESYRPENGKPYLMHLQHWDILGDVSVDDSAELRRVGFPSGFADVLGAMSQEARQVYKRSIGDIHDRPTALKDTKPKKFARILSSYGTYKTTDGAYFPRWEPGREGQGPIPSTYSDAMLANATHAVRLERERDYLMLMSPNGYRLFQLAENDGELNATEIAFSFDTFHDELPADRRRWYQAVLFYAAQGDDRTAPVRRRRYKVAGRGAERLMLDPRRKVEALVGEQDAASRLGLGEPFDWFCEMVAAYFPDRFTVLDFSQSAVQMDPAIMRGLKGWADQATREVFAATPSRNPFLAPLDEIHKQQVIALLGNPDVLVLPQGFITARNSRFIGGNLSYCYRRDIDNGAVVIESTTEFLRNLYVGGISQIVYDGTVGVIPLVALLFITVAAVPVTLAVGPAFLARYVTKELTRKGAERIALDLAKRAAPALAARMGSLVATVFIYAGDEHDPQGAGHRWRAFADGFFQGYLVNTIHDSFYRGVVVRNLSEGIPEYRYYKWAKRIYTAVDRAQRVVTLVQEKLDRESIDEGIALFKKAMGHTLQGVVLLVSALHYSSHDDAKAALQIFGAVPGGEPPDPAHWELESGHQVAHIAGQIEDALKLHDLDSLLEELENSRTLKFAITAAILNPHIWKAIAYTWGNRPFTWKKWQVKWIEPARPAIILVLVASMVGVLAYIESETDGGISDFPVDKLGEILWSLVSDLPGASTDRAKINGEIVGNLLGVFVFNSFIAKEMTFKNKKKKWADKSAGDKWAALLDTPLLGTTITGTMKIGVIGPILRLVFRRYVSLYEDLRRRGVFSLEQNEQSIGAFLSRVADDELERQDRAHLSHFRTDEESVSFSLEKLVVVLLRMRVMLARDLASYYRAAKDGPMADSLKDDLEAFKTLARESGVSAAVTAHGHTTYRLMAVHLHAAIGHLEEAIRSLMTTFTKTLPKMSWLDVLRELGLDVDLDKAEEAFKREVKRLEVFRGGQP